MEPSRWLVPPDYADMQWFLVYAVPLATWMLVFQLLGLYDRHRLSIYRTVLAVAVGFGVVVTLVFFFKGYNFSRLAAGAAWAFSTVLIAGWRLVARWYIHNRRGGHPREHGRVLPRLGAVAGARGGPGEPCPEWVLERGRLRAHHSVGSALKL